MTEAETKTETQCKGDGSCLGQGDTENDCVRVFECVHACVALPCPNYILCRVMAPAWYFDCHDGRCTNCDCILGQDLQITHVKAPTQCRACTIDRHSFVASPYCEHSLCIFCAKDMVHDCDWECPLCSKSQRRGHAKRKCEECGGKLVAIGNRRANGADHEDWDRRLYHKKCWKQRQNA